MNEFLTFCTNITISFSLTGYSKAEIFLGQNSNPIMFVSIYGGFILKILVLGAIKVILETFLLMTLTVHLSLSL